MQKLYRIIIGSLLAVIASFSSFAAQPASAAHGPHYTCAFYVVERGDTLNKIARWEHSTVNDIMWANGLRNWWIYPGQRLCIPRYAPVGHPQRPAPPKHAPVNPWLAQYWSNADLTGAPVSESRPPYINFDWGYGTPDPSKVTADNFSARYTRSSWFTGGRWRFNVTHDDGVRLYVNDVLLIDQWTFQGQKTSSVERDLSDGTLNVRLEFVERGGKSLLSLGFERIGPAPVTPPAPAPAPAPSSGVWTGSFYNNMELSGTAAFVGNYNGLNLNWGFGSPNPTAVYADNFSARFTSRQAFAGGIHRFSVQADDGVRVYIGGVKIIDTWATPNYGVVTSGDVNLAAGEHDLTVELYEKTGVAGVNLSWIKP